MKCKPEILMVNDLMSVGQCIHCKRVGVHFQNLLAGFNHRDFLTWANWVGQLDFRPNATLFHDGQFRIILNTCHSDLQFTFTESEFHAFKDGISEALLQLRAQELMGGG